MCTRMYTLVTLNDIKHNDYSIHYHFMIELEISDIYYDYIHNQ